ncbi:ABC transporter substrate-binding protein [Promicromonospora sp. NPDC060271]|uniref:ABC transporter substrate-binding protein n=1 Tax=Promicromonospora sp. NPDC060271 TaxID=3347089 RepID=UPI003651DF58
MRRIHKGAGMAALAAVGMLLAGCGIASTGSGDVELSEQDVTISMTWWGGDARTQATLEAIELFEADHPNITVEPQFADWSGYWDRLATTTAGGEAPDVMQFDEVYLASYGARGALTDLESLSGVLKTDDLDDSVLDSGRVGEQLLGLPIGAAPNGVIINKSLFEKYDVPLPDTTSWTWDEFNATAEALSDASGGEVRGVNLFGADTFSLRIWARQHGDELFDADGNVAISAKTVEDYFDLERSWIDSGASASAAEWAETSGVPLDQSSIVTGGVGMMFIAAGSFPSYQAAAPDFEYTIANWPTDDATEDGFQYLKPSMYWSVSSRSEHPAEAGLLVNFLNSDERVAELFGVERGVPVNPVMKDAVAGSLDEANQLVVDFTEDMGEESGPGSPVTPNGASDVQTIIGRYNEQVLLGQMSVEEAAAGFIDEVQNAIDAAS